MGCHTHLSPCPLQPHPAPPKGSCPQPLCPAVPHRIDEHAGGGILPSGGTAQLQAEGVGDALLQADGLGQHHVSGWRQSRAWAARCLPRALAQSGPSKVLTWRQRGGWWRAGHQPGWCFRKGCWRRQGWGAAPLPSPPARAPGAAGRERAVPKSLTVQYSPPPPLPNLAIHPTASFTTWCPPGAHSG